jgi:hypothetical protein
MSARSSLNAAWTGAVDAKQEVHAVGASIQKAMNEFKGMAWDDENQALDYARVKESAAYADYQTLVRAGLDAVDPTLLSCREAQLAFWINIYNALVLDAVIALEIKTGITEGFLGILRFFRQAAYRIGGQRVSLEDIEHGILRGNRGHPYQLGPQFGSADPRLAWVIEPQDARIHFALNCATQSCPPIGIYQAEQIDRQLDLATANFLGQEVDLDRENGVLTISAVLNWYIKDFGGRRGLLSFLGQHLPDAADRVWLQEHVRPRRWRTAKYLWALNKV